MVCLDLFIGSLINCSCLSGGRVCSAVMDEVGIPENKKQRKRSNGSLKRHQSGRQWDGFGAGQAELIMRSDNSDSVGDNPKWHPATHTPLQDSSNSRTWEGHQLQNGIESYSKAQNFDKQHKNLHSKEQWESYTPSDICINTKDSNKGEEKSVVMESVDQEYSAEAAGEQEEISVPSVTYNFDNPLMALTYSKEFNTSEENFTKGCKWLVIT